jgi:hypothetical protein
MDVQPLTSAIPLLDGQMYKALYPPAEGGDPSKRNCFPWTLTAPYSRFDLLPGSGTGPTSATVGPLQNQIPSQFTHYIGLFSYWTTDRSRIGLGGVFFQGSSTKQYNIAPDYVDSALLSAVPSALVRFVMFPIEPGSTNLQFQPTDYVGRLLTAMPLTDELHAQIYVASGLT